MSKIRDLKTNPENSINIVNIVEMFSPDAKSKYTDMLLRLMKSTPNLKEHTKEIKSEILSVPFWTRSDTTTPFDGSILDSITTPADLPI